MHYITSARTNHSRRHAHQPAPFLSPLGSDCFLVGVAKTSVIKKIVTTGERLREVNSVRAGVDHPVQQQQPALSGGIMRWLLLYGD